jgi:hypothetical protein
MGSEESQEKEESEEKKGVGRSLLIGIGVAIVALVVSAALVLTNGDKTEPGAGPSTTEAGPDQPAIKQARWRVEGSIVGAESKGKRRQLLRQRIGVVSTAVKDIYEAFFVQPEMLADMQKAHFTRSAARALDRSKIVAGKDLERVKTLSRKAEIGLQGPAGAAASAEVTIRLRALAGKKTVRLAHHATLWLEHVGKKWLVIGFEAEQKPVKR